MPIAFPLQLIKNKSLGNVTFISNQTINKSREQTSKQDQISIFVEIAKEWRTDYQKIKFFDSSKEEIFTDLNESTSKVNEDIPKKLDDEFYVYANM